MTFLILFLNQALQKDNTIGGVTPFRCAFPYLGMGGGNDDFSPCPAFIIEIIQED